MNAHQRPHYIIKPAEIADWLDREPGTWWIVHGDPRLGGKVDFPCPSCELSGALRGYSKDIFIYTLPAGPIKSRPHGQTINSQGLLGNCSIITHAAAARSRRSRLEPA